MGSPRRDLTQANSSGLFSAKLDPENRKKAIILCVLIAIILVWVGFVLIPMVTPKKKAVEQQTAGWILARELNEALVKHHAFADTSFAVESEEPLKLKLYGMVKTQQDLSRLREFVKQLRPDAPSEQFDYQVEVRR